MFGTSPAHLKRDRSVVVSEPENIRPNKRANVSGIRKGSGERDEAQPGCRTAHRHDLIRAIISGRQRRGSIGVERVMKSFVDQDRMRKNTVRTSGDLDTSFIRVMMTSKVAPLSSPMV